MSIDYQLLESILEQTIDVDKSIRWAGIVNDNGVILNSKQRVGLSPLLTQEENEEYAVSAITRHRTRAKFEPKIGRLQYAFGRYEELSRATIPIINHRYYLLVTFDKEESNFDSIIIKKILPLLKSRSEALGEGPHFSPSSSPPQDKKNSEAVEYEAGTFRCSICAKEFLTNEDAINHDQEHKRESISASE